MTPQLSFACLILVWGLVVLLRSVWALLDWLLSARGLRRLSLLLGSFLLEFAFRPVFAISGGCPPVRYQVSLQLLFSCRASYPVR